MQKMSPAAERLVRLMLLLPPDSREELWKSAADDCGDHSTVMSIRWWVGDTAKMVPEGAPRTLAEMVLTVFSNPSETTLRLLSEVIVAKSSGTGVGETWAARARETAIDVLAECGSLEQVLEQAKSEWTLR